MHRMLGPSFFWLRAALALVTGCGDRSSTATSAAAGADMSRQPAAINFYNFTGEIGSHTLTGFEQRTGIRVRFSDIPDNATLQTKLLTGHSDYDALSRRRTHSAP